jgi:spoIIIJ-associated protein
MSPSESIETTAATIDQAISDALAQLGAEQDDVTIEVLSTPRSGVLGLGVRQARVRVTKRAREGAHSGVMSPPPAPPLRPTPPEMRRPEARRSEAATAEALRETPRPERSEVARGAQDEVRRDERSESRADSHNDAPREQREPRRDMPPRRDPRRPGDEREQARGGPSAGQRDNRRDGGRNAPRTAPSPGRANASAQEAEATEGSEVARDNARIDESPSQQANREGGSRGRRGRGRRGRRQSGQPDNAPVRTAQTPEPERERESAQGYAQEDAPDHPGVHDDERDPFAILDESGNDSRKSADLWEQAREATIFLQRLLELMGEKATIETAESDDPETLELNIKGDGSGLLIGRHGQTLDAIEYMVNRLLARQIKDAAPISIDTESYRARRRRLLQRMALSKGEQAKREHVPVMIEPMPPRDRRIVHLALQDDPMITTRSTGDGFMRAIEIVPVDERRSPNERGGENRGRGRGREHDRDEDKTPALGEQGGFKHGQKRIV